MDPDPGGTKTCGSGFGFGSATLFKGGKISSNNVRRTYKEYNLKWNLKKNKDRKTSTF
jgi:hypothetical protein